MPNRFVIDPSSSLALYLQIQIQIIQLIKNGQFSSGDTLPSIRSLAENYHINPNTVTKAYRELGIRGLLTSRKGMGYIVVDNAIDIASRLEDQIESSNNPKTSKPDFEKALDSDSISTPNESPSKSNLISLNDHLLNILTAVPYLSNKELVQDLEARYNIKVSEDEVESILRSYIGERVQLDERGRWYIFNKRVNLPTTAPPPFIQIKNTEKEAETPIRSEHHQKTISKFSKTEIAIPPIPRASVPDSPSTSTRIENSPIEQSIKVSKATSLEKLNDNKVYEGGNFYIVCSHCEQLLEIPESSSGDTGRCDFCKKIFQVPHVKPDSWWENGLNYITRDYYRKHVRATNVPLSRYTREALSTATNIQEYIKSKISSLNLEINRNWNALQANHKTERLRQYPFDDLVSLEGVGVRTLEQLRGKEINDVENLVLFSSRIDTLARVSSKGKESLKSFAKEAVKFAELHPPRLTPEKAQVQKMLEALLFIETLESGLAEISSKDKTTKKKRSLLNRGTNQMALKQEVQDAHLMLFEARRAEDIARPEFENLNQ